MVRRNLNDLEISEKNLRNDLIQTPASLVAFDMSNQRPVRADVKALSGLLRQFDNELKEQGRTEERGIVLDALRKLEVSPALNPASGSSESSIHQRTVVSDTKQNEKASAA